MFPIMKNQGAISPITAITKTIVLIPSLLVWGTIFLVMFLIGLGIMFVVFPTFTFLLKYFMIMIAGLIIFSVSYGMLTAFMREYMATAVISVIVAIMFMVVMRMFPFYWLIVITVIIGIAWTILKTAGITRIFGGE